MRTRPDAPTREFIRRNPRLKGSALAVGDAKRL